MKIKYTYSLIGLDGVSPDTFEARLIYRRPDDSIEFVRVNHDCKTIVEIDGVHSYGDTDGLDFGYDCEQAYELAMNS